MTRLAADRRFYGALCSASSVVPRQRRVQAMRWYNRLFLPLGLLLQWRVGWAPGLIDVETVDELLLVCGRGGGPSVRCTAAQADALRLAPQSVITGWRSAGREPS